MPLLDHFHAPLHPQRHWEALHSRWANAMADALNEDLLPHDYFAEPETHANGQVEIEVATFRIQVFRNDGSAVLVGAIELASPGNKDRSEQRRAFATKCANYLYHGVSLVIVDVVTNRKGNLHNELIRLMDRESSYLFGSEASLYAAAYRPVRRATAELVEIWPSALLLGEFLPTLPLFLGGELCVPVNLEATYSEACRRLRLA